MISSITEQWQGSAGTLEWAKWRRTYKRVFKAYSDDNDDTPITVRTALAASSFSIALLDAYPGDSLALVKNIDVTRSQEDPLIWNVNVTYDSVFEIPPTDMVENPLLRPAIWEFSFEKYSKAVREDLNFGPIENSAGTPYEPPLEVAYSLPLIKITVNKSTWDYTTVSQCQDACNDAEWQSFPANTVLIRGVEARKMFENNVSFWQLVWTLAIKSEDTVGGPWRPTKVLDQGYYHLENVGTEEDPDEVQLINRDRYGQPLPHPVLLDGEGGKLETGGTPVFNEFYLVREVDFTTLPIL